MSSARVRLPRGLDDLLRSEMELCITQANLGQEDTEIAKRYLIDQWAQIDIAAELGWTRSTVSIHVARIVSKVDVTARKLHMA